MCDPATMSCLDVDLDNQREWSAASLQGRAEAGHCPDYLTPLYH